MVFHPGRKPKELKLIIGVRILSASELKYMTEEEKAAEAAALAAAEAAKGAADTVVVIDPLKEKDEKIAKLTEDLENYKKVALKRLGKLPGDADFLDTDGTGLSVAEQVRIELLNREIDAEKKAKDDDTRKILKENSELKLALKNRPGSSIGSEGGSVVEVKDNVFSPEQIAALKQTAVRLKADPDKFIETAKRNFLARK